MNAALLLVAVAAVVADEAPARADEAAVVADDASRLQVDRDGAATSPAATAPATAATARDATWDDRFAAATSSGLSSFVGMAMGGLGLPAAIFGAQLGLSRGAGVSVALPTDTLLYATTAGGIAGAMIGGAIGSFAYTEWYGPIAVAGAGGAGAAVGLVGAAVVAKNAGAGLLPNDPVLLAGSGLMLLGVVAGGGAAAAVGALCAAPPAPAVPASSTTVPASGR